MRIRSSVLSIPSLLLLAACSQSTEENGAPASNDPPATSESPAPTPPAPPSQAPAPVDQGAVFTISNDASANEVYAFRRDESGALQRAGIHPTGGRGTGKGLGSQGALALSPDGKVLVVVDAGTNQISSFSVDGATLAFRSRVSSGGMEPVSVAVYGQLVYALNAGGTSNVSGFRLDADGSLSPIASSQRALSTAATGPAQISFSPKGDNVVVTEKATNKLDTFIVKQDGSLSGGEAFASSGMTPFGFAFTPSGQLVVTEAFGAAPGAGAVSSYAFDTLFHAGPRGGAERGITTVSPSVASGQTAPCWVVVTGDGKFAYTTNTPSGNISAYGIAQDGKLALVGDGAAAPTGDGSRPIDATLDKSSKRLYVLKSGLRKIGVYDVKTDGSLAGRNDGVEVPATSAGLIGN